MKKIWILILLLITYPAWATTKTVCDSGCDNTTIAAALTAVGNGTHTITVQGTYTAAESITISQSGTDASNRLTIQASGTQTVKRFLINGSYLVIDGFTFDGYTGVYDAMVQLGDNAGSGISYITVQNCTFNNTSETASVHPVASKDAAGNFSSPLPDHILIDSNEFDGQSYYIAIFGTNYTFSNNTVHDNIDGTDATWVCGQYITVSGNEFYNIDEEGETHTDIVQTAGTACGQSEDVVWERNFIHDSIAQPGNFSADGDEDFGNWVIRNNIYYNMTYRFNIGIPNVEIYNNTWYKTATDGGNVINSLGEEGGNPFNCSNHTVKNNIFINAGSGATTGWYGTDCDGTFVADYNYVAEPTTYAEKTGLSETHGVNGGNPYLSSIDAGTAAGFALTANSTILIGTGANLYAIFTDDYAGTARDNAAFDIGAYEYEEGSILYPSATIGSGASMSIGAAGGAVMTLQ